MVRHSPANLTRPYGGLRRIYCGESTSLAYSRGEVLNETPNPSPAANAAAPKHARPKTIEPRWRKLQRLGQAHLAPGMSLQRWRDLLDLYDIGELADAPDRRIDGLIAEISEIVRLAKKGTLPL